MARLEDREEIIIAGGHIITGLLDAISPALPFKTLIYSSDDESAYELAKQGLVDILALDDPQIAFNFDLQVKGSAQRLAWQTLKQSKIPYSVERVVKSQFDAYKIVKNSNDLYTFLNASYFSGLDILKDETRHVVSLVQCNDDKRNIYPLIEYLLMDGQKDIGEQGFVPIRPWKLR